ncbi:major facilitator superfamily domain-containing protein [Gymnopilus junonius]|uniref:Major facilitator superfamily domain-containing protein n=1 Tax=Gymnopilus junonius TaxID=109634 RepID=A0A9P5NLC0_GYMJU|nr:major facilitator superfamily domain-containing protein [Gymnopilus junonius]
MFCVSACVFETFIWGWNNTYGIFQGSSSPPFDNASPAAISIIGTASLGIQYMEIIVLIAFFQRYPEYAKPSMWICLFICVVSLIVSSFATQIWHLILLQGVIFGLSAGILYAPIVMWLSDWFVTRRGLAGGIIFGGSGVGGFVFPLAMGYLLNAVGFRWTLRIWALALGACCGIALIGVNPRIPVRKPSMDVPRHPWFPTDLSRLKSPLMAIILGTNIVQALGFFPVSLFVPTYTSSLLSGTLPSTIVLALFNAASVIFYIMFGRICDSYPYPYVILASGVGSSLAALLLWGFASSLGWVFAFAAVFGGLSGGFPGVWPAAASEIGGPLNHITSLAFGCFAVVKGIAAIIGPIIAASLHDRSNHAKSVYGGFGFRNVEIFVGVMAAATSVGAVVLSFYSTSKRRTVARRLLPAPPFYK